MITPFDYRSHTRIVFGPDRLDELGTLAAQMDVHQALVVTDAGVRAAGHVDRAVAALEQSRIATRVFAEVAENPTADDIGRGLEVARKWAPDVIVGIGGGSSMDSAKGVNFLYTNGGRIEDYWGEGKAAGPMLPSIGVPTTAGTGSETQSFALISDPCTHRKMACGDKKVAFRIALLDPRLTLTQPASVTATTGIDAVAHAVETYVSRRRNPVSLAFSREAWRLLSRHFSRVLDHPDDLDARSHMQLGASFAGLAIEHSMLGAAHALANPLSASYGVVHGQAVGLMLPHVIRFNGHQFGHWYAELLQWTADPDDVEHHDGVKQRDDQRTGAAEALAERVTGWLQRAGLATRLGQCGVDEAVVTDLAREAAEEWTGKFNPRDVNPAELAELYRRAL